MTTYSTAEDFQQPILQFIGSKGNWLSRRFTYRLVDDYWLEWGRPDKRKRLFMKRGFEFNKADVPWWAAGLGFKSDGENDGPSMFHDRFWRDKGKFTPGEFVYQVQVNGEWVEDSSRWSTAETNEFFMYNAELAKIPKVAAWAQKEAVSLWPPNWLKRF